MSMNPTSVPKAAMSLKHIILRQYIVQTDNSFCRTSDKVFGNSTNDWEAAEDWETAKAKTLQMR